MASEKTTVILLMDPAEVKRIDDFRFAHRFSNRAAALRWLLADSLDRQESAAKAAETTA